MKEAANIDELLNGYIDEELTPRQMTEVQRLIANDEAIAMRLRELQRCKLLVGCLPVAEAPGHVFGDIRGRLERQSLLESEPQVVRQRRGWRELVARKMVSLAAVLVLAGGLAAVVLVIVSGGNSERPVIAVDKPAIVGAGETPEGSEAVTVADSGAQSAAKDALKGRLELKTATFIAVEALIGDAIEERGLAANSSWQVEDSKAVYSINGRKAELAMLISDLAEMWPRFEATSFYVDSETAADRAWVSNVKPSQVLEVIGQSSDEMAIKAAKYAAINNASDPVFGSPVAGTEGEAGLPSIPKPVLAWGKDNARGGEADEQMMELTIVVTGAD
jgi:hypothetical protein